MRKSKNLGKLLPTFIFLTLISAACSTNEVSNAERPLRVSGSTTVNPIVAEAAEIFREQGNAIQVDTLGGSSGGLAQLERQEIDIAMSSKPLSSKEKETLIPTRVGSDALGVMVNSSVMESGIDGLERQQIAAIFEGEIVNWKELGGSDTEIIVYDKEPGRGTREVFDAFLYGKSSDSGGEPEIPERSQQLSYSVVGANEESRQKIATTPGAIGPLSIAFADDDVKPLAVDGVKPTIENIDEGAYALARPLILATRGEPEGQAANFIELVLSESGQEIVKSLGYLTVEN